MGVDHLAKPKLVSGWIAPTLSGNWINYNNATTYRTAGYKISSDNRVEFKGLVENGAAPASEVFVLAVGFRPLFELQLICPVYDGTAYTIGRLFIEPGGEVNLQSIYSGLWNTSTGILFLDGIGFYADGDRST